MTRAAYLEIGGIRGTLGRRANVIYDELDAAGQETAHEFDAGMENVVLHKEKE